MFFSIANASDSSTLPGPGAIIKVGQARDYIRAYHHRTQQLLDAFDQLPSGTPAPFDPNQESLGWVFSRDVIEKFLAANPSSTTSFFALVFGVAPKEFDKNGNPKPYSPNVLHAMMTTAVELGDGQFQLNKLGSAIKDDEDFGAEQGTTCCQGTLLGCTRALLDNGIVSIV